MTKSTEPKQISLRIRQDYIKFVDAYAASVGLSRNKVMENMIGGLKSAEQDIQTQGTFLNLMTSEMERSVARLMEQQKPKLKRKRK